LDLAGEIFWSFGGEVPSEKPRGLAHLNEIVVGVPHIATQFRSAVYGRGEKRCSAFAPPSMTIGDISDPQIEKDRRCVARLVIHDRDVGFVGGWPSSGVHENPRVGQPHDAGVLFEDDDSSQDV
jgi:hypothetical protein